MNKKGASLSSWTEVALMVTLFVVLLGTLFVHMNAKYGKSYDLTFDGHYKFADLSSKTLSSLAGYQDTLQKSVLQGKADNTGLGISLSTTWQIIAAGMGIMWEFTTGGWIEQVVAMAALPDMVGRVLRILFVLSIGFILLKLILKVKP